MRAGDIGTCSSNRSIIADPNVERSPETSWLAIVVFAVYMIMSNVLLLNLLVAMFWCAVSLCRFTISMKSLCHQNLLKSELRVVFCYEYNILIKLEHFRTCLICIRWSCCAIHCSFVWTFYHSFNSVLVIFVSWYLGQGP